MGRMIGLGQIDYDGPLIDWKKPVCYALFVGLSIAGIGKCTNHILYSGVKPIPRLEPGLEEYVSAYHSTQSRVQKPIVKYEEVPGEARGSIIDLASRSAITDITGKIVDVDEDMLQFDLCPCCSNYPADNRGTRKTYVDLLVEHLRLEDDDGKQHRLLLPRPSRYRRGDEATFTYQKRGGVSLDELYFLSRAELPDTGTHPDCQPRSVQAGSFGGIDGVIVK